MGNVHGRREAVDEAQAEASFKNYVALVELNNCLCERARRNPCFLRRSLKYRAPPRSSTERRETFELALSVSALSSRALTSSAGQAHTTVFVALCDAAPEGNYVVKCAWRLKATAGMEAVDGRRSLLSLPSAMLRQKGGLELVFFVWEARDDLHWIGGASGACVTAGMQAGRVFGLVPEGSSVSWCHLRADDVSADAETAARAAMGRLPLSRATLRRSAEPTGQGRRLSLRFEAVSVHPSQPPQQLHFSISGFRCVDVPSSPEAAPAAERAFDSSGSPCRVWFHFLYDRNLRRHTEEHLLSTHSDFAYTFSDPVSAIPAVNVSCTQEAARLAGANQVLGALAKEFRFQSRRYGSVAAPVTARQAALFAPVVESALVHTYTKRKHSDAWADGDDSDDSVPAGVSKTAQRSGLGMLLPDALPTKRMVTRPRQPIKPIKAAMRLPTQSLSLADQAAAGKFYHARTAMKLHPSELEEGYRDSDDDVDEQHWQTKCRRGIDEFGDVTQVEKEFMFLWNTYTHKRHIYADALLTEAVADFARLHRAQLCADPELRRCFTLHLINLWDVCLLDSAALDEALRLIDARE